MKRLNDESGQALIITALCMTCLFGFVALAADVGIMLREKRMAQTAADGAAVAGASELAYDWSGAAKATSALNGFSDTVNGVTVVVNKGPANGPHVGDTSYVEVIVSKVQPTWFMSLFGVLNMTPTARAVATYGQTNGCIFTLGTSGRDISVVGNADITVKTCGITDNSKSDDALYLQGSATLTANSIGVAGNVTETGGAVNLTPTNPVTGIVPVSDPLAPVLGSPPAPTGCINVPTGATTLTPGCYNGISVANNKTLTLSPGTLNPDGTYNPGVYVINGPLSLSGTATLTSLQLPVELVLYGTTSMGGNTTLNLTAGDSGKGVLIWQPASNINALTLIGNPGSTLTGIVYAPAAAVTVQGNAGATIAVDFVVSQLSLIGNATLTSYAAINSGSALKTIRLVE